MRSKIPAQLLSSAHNQVHILKRYLFNSLKLSRLSNVPLPEGLGGTTREHSKQEKFLLPPYKYSVYHSPPPPTLSLLSFSQASMLRLVGSLVSCLPRDHEFSSNSSCADLSSGPLICPSPPAQRSEQVLPESGLLTSTRLSEFGGKCLNSVSTES
jgi:hypothetical protein